ncbi:MAG: hypothetical protein BWY57_02873 [Betaproteobacteria bacterium ADurb.Bin341]|nr:MAG: hypothetical protein BWY57_02873 [Betaproteobacteria bacterium ADurb.Bin341]
MAGLNVPQMFGLWDMCGTVNVPQEAFVSVLRSNTEG